MPTTADPVEIVCADAFDVLAQLDEGSVTHTITDPPYAQKTHAGARTTKTAKKFTTAGLIDFESISSETFLRFCREALRVTQRWVFMTCDWRHAALAEDAMPDEFIRLGCWIKPNGAPQFTGDRPGTGWEAILILHRKGMKKWNGGGHHATWTHNMSQSKHHPTEKPVGLVRQWVRQFTDYDDLVLDPFAGSFTTAMACLYEGRRCLSIEREEKYCALGRRRIGKLRSGDCLVPYTPRDNKLETLF